MISAKYIGPLTAGGHTRKETKRNQCTQAVRNSARNAENKKDNIANVVDRRSAIEFGKRCPCQGAKGIAQNINGCYESAESLISRVEMIHNEWSRRCAHRGCKRSGKLLAVKGTTYWQAIWD